MLKIFLWLRYLRKKKIVLLSVTAIALSVSLLIVVSSLFTGFINAFEQAAAEAIGNVVLSPPIKFPKYEQLIERLEETEAVEAATAMLTTQGLLHLGKGNVRAVEIWGIEPERRAKVTGFDRFLLRQKDLTDEPSFQIEGAEKGIGAFVGIGVLAEPDEKTDKYDTEAVKKMLGKQIVLTTGSISEASEEKNLDIQRKVISFTIVDIAETGVYQFDRSCVYFPIEELNKRLYPDKELPVASQINIKLADNTDTETALAIIRGVWFDFVKEHLEGDLHYLSDLDRSIVTSQELQRPFIAAYEKQMGILLAIFGIVSFCVVLLIFCIFHMIVRLKQKDVAIIKSCGATSTSVVWIFMGFGACVGVIGSGFGTVLGYIFTRNVNIIEEWIGIIFGLKLWQSSVYMFSKIPNEVDWSTAFSIIQLAIAAATIGTLIPAIVAARTRPVEILRYE